MELIVAGAIILFTIIPGNNEPKDLISSPLKISTQVVATQTPTPSPTPSGPTIHIVASGETMDTIAQNEYGSSKFWKVIWNDNENIEDPRIIHAGMELKIRNPKPSDTEELNEKLLKIYDELTAPSPTPIPTIAPTQPANVNPVTSGSFDEAYRQAGARFGVPWEILYGLHHMETGGRDGAISSGYGTGAQGPLQFMPGTWASYGIDGNGDGNVDINNAIDAIFGAANFIALHGGVEQGLKSYGGNSQMVLDYARSRGYNQ
jgi:hypothetical protein